MTPSYTRMVRGTVAGAALVVAGTSVACGGSDRTSSGGSDTGVRGAVGGNGGNASSGGRTASADSSSGGNWSAGSAGMALPVDECVHPDTDWVFCSGFEEGSKAIWDDYDGNPDETNMLIEAPGPFSNVGNHVMRLRAPAGRGGADLVKVLPVTADRLYARWYIRYEPGFDFTAPNHGGGLHAGPRDWLGHSDTRPDGNDWYTAWVEHDPSLGGRPYVYSYYAGMYMDCVDPNGSCWGDHFPCMMDDGSNYCTNPAHRERTMPAPLTTDRWYCVELMLDGGTPTPANAGASGSIDFWIDGTEAGPFENLWMRTKDSLDVTILWLNLFHHGDHSIAGVMYDHVVVSRSRVGCAD